MRNNRKEVESVINTPILSHTKKAGPSKSALTIHGFTSGELAALSKTNNVAFENKIKAICLEFKG